jgi:5-methylcytosine-specific restriction enzyme subunit McrC
MYKIILASEHDVINEEDFEILKTQKSRFASNSDSAFKPNQLSYFIGLEWITPEKVLSVTPKIDDEKVKTDYLSMLMNGLQYKQDATFLDELFKIEFNQPLILIEQKQDLLTPLLTIQFLELLKTIVRKGLKNLTIKSKEI